MGRAAGRGSRKDPAREEEHEGRQGRRKLGGQTSSTPFGRRQVSRILLGRSRRVTDAHFSSPNDNPVAVPK